MDWQRAKTILIVAFVIVNLFLLYQIQETMRQKSEYIAVDKISDQQIENLLSDNQMTLAIPRPKDVNESTIWQASLSKIEGWQELDHGYQKRFANQTKIYKIDQLHTFLRKEVPVFSDYQIQSRPKNFNGKWIYTQKISNRPLFDGKLEVQIENNQIRSLFIVHYKLQENPKNVDISDFNNALYSLINYGSSNKAQVIRKVELGYRAQAYNDQRTFILPVWRFQVDDQQFDVYATRFGSTKSVEVVNMGR